MYSNQVLPLEQDLPEKSIKGLVGVSGGETWKAYGEEQRVTFGPGSQFVINNTQ